MNADLAGYTETRPWGSFTVLLDAPSCKVKSITVLPDHRLSLQMHNRREEHWVIVEGEGILTLGEEDRPVKAGDNVFVPCKTKHRIAGTGSKPLVFIEVQRGDYFGEDDIIRFEDDYNRK